MSGYLFGVRYAFQISFIHISRSTCTQLLRITQHAVQDEQSLNSMPSAYQCYQQKPDCHPAYIGLLEM